MDYTPKRSRNIYLPGDEKPFKVSRSKVELFLECPRCFYMDRRCGINRPPSYQFNLNLAVDHLMKKEFDIYRKQKIAHPIMEAYDKDLALFDHEDLGRWRENFVGVQYFHEDTNLVLTGAVDDLWKKDDKVVVVDYKATSSNYPISYKSPRYDQNKRQLDFYTYLLQQNGQAMGSDGYFVVCNGKRNEDRFDNALHFDVSIIKHKINLDWIEDTIFDLFETLCLPKMPESSESCHFCQYRSAIGLL